MTVGLVAFLRARLDEDERTARAALDSPGRASWQALGTGVYAEAAVREQDDPPPLTTTGPEVGGSDEDAARAAHIALHDPARVLRDVQARSTTVDEYDIALWAAVDDDRAAYWQGRLDALRESCLRIAWVYADHEGYQQAVAPEPV
ncbi:DUF6221 family protein [uncultured Streptomyces sp.]|uniref:DUF6221 family protein n=1 Tax=uncultured Streptomyces sp. TaxID=174707 RepID=UPI0026295838|nr:DUF6221 family protein [uncultured Streptomyces sp.]